MNGADERRPKAVREILLKIKNGSETKQDRRDFMEIEGQLHAKIGKTRTLELINKIKKEIGFPTEKA